MIEEKFTFVVAVNDIEVLRRNLYLSPGLLGDHRHQLLIKENYSSASLAYNSAIDEAENEIIIFIHQDIYLPKNWFLDVRRCLLYFEERKINWGVLGCYGSKKAEVGVGRLCDTPWGIQGRQLNNPEPVDTLDEVVLLVRKSSGLRFDPYLPHFHLYGADLCMTAKNKGMINFAFQGYCIHNTKQLLILPREYYNCYYYVKRKWAKFLPIYTSCITISRYNEEVYLRVFRELINKILGIRKVPKSRVDDPRTLMGDEV